MMTAGCFLRVSLFTLLVVATCGIPQKGSQSTGQSSGGGNAAVNYASYRGGAPSFRTAPYSGGAYGATSATMFQPVSSGYQPLLVAPVMSSSGPSAMQGAGVASLGVQGAGMVPQGAGVASLGVQGAGMVPQGAGVASLGVQGAGGVPLGVQVVGVAPTGQAGALVSGPVGAAYVSPVIYEPVAESTDGLQEEPATQWTMPTTIFEAGSTDAQAIEDLVPSAPSGPQGPTLQSGEASSVTKEAELGNYQQQTEEFGYPADLGGSGQGFGQGLGTVLVSGGQLGGFRPMSAGRFDRMFIYGMLPTGSYSTFSHNHEAGKDFSQAIHYLKEHVTESHGSGQQKKFFPGAR